MLVGLRTASLAAYHQAMSSKVFGIVVLVLYAVATMVALAIKVRDVGLMEGLSVWRKTPRHAILIVLEVAGVATAAVRATYTTRWTAVVWTVVGIALAYALVRTLRKKSGGPTAQTLQTPPQEGPTAALSESQAGAGDNAGPPPSPRVEVPRSGKPDFRGVYEYGPRAQGNEGRAIIRQHALTYIDGVPESATLCGFHYAADDLPVGHTAILWGIGIPKPMRCPTCTQALRAEHYTLWNIDPWALGRP